MPVLYWCQFFKPRVRHPSFSFMIRSNLLICGYVLSSVTNSLGIKALNIELLDVFPVLQPPAFSRARTGTSAQSHVH